jgi:DNA-binding PadR family transcriptional regulator
VSLRFALLGLLAECPMSGYELTKTFEGPANVWSARHSQIYPELARLLADGLIREHERGGRNRKTYAITNEGLRAVRGWLTQTEPDRTVRDDSFLRVFFLWLVPNAQAEAYLRQELEYHRTKLARYEAMAEGWHSTDPAERSNRIALQAGILHERALAEWAEWALTQLPLAPASSRRLAARAVAT